jgi:very-short-patch-repair endonuclease
LRIAVSLPPDLPEAEYLRWGYSLGYALRIGFRHLYMLDGPEIDFVLEPMWEQRTATGKCRTGSLTFIDPAVGGSGFLDRAAEELHLVARRTIEHLDHQGCENACYRCLKSYNNQRHHQYLSWPIVMPDLEALAVAPPVPLPLSKGDLLDPVPWLEAFDNGVGSPLELKFLRLLEEKGLKLEKQVPVAVNAREPPISTADFVVAGSQVAIYVDGAAFHRGLRLRRDRAIRKRLLEGNPGWRVIEVGAKDLGRIDKVLAEIKAAVENRRK